MHHNKVVVKINNMESAGEELPTQITCFEILPRLPSKSLMRFKCVCKSWSSLTRNPSFVDAHHNLGCNKHTHLLLTASDKPTRQQHFFSIQLDHQGNTTTPIHLLTLPTPRTKNERLYNAQSINGLVCIYLYSSSLLNQPDPENPVRIFNPCTRECIALPHSSPASPKAHVTHHFGFSPVTNEYKVLQVQKFIPTMRGTHPMFKIFKLGTSSWRRIEVDANHSFNHLNCRFHKKSLCINGAIHWMQGAQNGIVAFDIAQEKFRVIPVPKDYNHLIIPLHYPFLDIVELGGCLGLVGDRHLTQNLMGLWILKDYENQVWVKVVITFPSLWRELGCPIPFCTIHTGEVLLQSSWSIRQNPPHVTVHPYDMQSESFRGSESIVLPTEWTFLDGPRLKLVANYEDSIVPLR